MTQPFGDPIGDRSRDLYGEYRPRPWRTKVGIWSNGLGDCVAGTWVTIDVHTAHPWIWTPLSPTVHDISMYRLMFYGLGWLSGEFRYRILIDGVKVYPFAAYGIGINNLVMRLGVLSAIVRTGEVAEVQFMSSDPADAGVTIGCYVRSAILREV